MYCSAIVGEAIWHVVCPQKNIMVLRSILRYWQWFWRWTLQHGVGDMREGDTTGTTTTGPRRDEGHKNVMSGTHLLLALIRSFPSNDERSMPARWQWVLTIFDEALVLRRTRRVTVLPCYFLVLAVEISGSWEKRSMEWSGCCERGRADRCWMTLDWSKLWRLSRSMSFDWWFVHTAVRMHRRACWLYSTLREATVWRDEHVSDRFQKWYLWPRKNSGCCCSLPTTSKYYCTVVVTLLLL